MKIVTKFFGELTIGRKEIIDFPAGLPGFEQEKAFVLLKMEDEGVYQVLQSVHRPEVALIVTNPYLFLPNYEFEIELQTQKLLKIVSPEDVIILSVVTLRDPFSKTTVNLQAPLVVNYNKNIGKQVILNDTSYHTKHLLASFRKEAVQHAGAESKNK
ncbi:flagellar assembly protein FliW [Halobacillus sp. MO56]